MTAHATFAIITILFGLIGTHYMAYLLGRLHRDQERNQRRH